MYRRLALSCLLTIGLAACDSEDDIVTQIVTQLGAATEHPCFEQFEYQFELNGSPADTRKRSEVLDGETIVTEEHWYPATQMILFYTYTEGGDWCNNWNENGVSW
jgi:hypothetical protein